MHLAETLQLTASLDGARAGASPADASRGPGVSRSAPLLAGGQVLCVDDEAVVRRLLGMMLRKAGFEVTLAASGDEALDLLAAGERFDALVTDYAMPGLDGRALVELALGHDPGLPALIVTGYTRDAGLERLPTAASVLTKPFGRIEFIQRIEILVRSRRASGPDDAVRDGGDGFGLHRRG